MRSTRQRAGAPRPRKIKDAALQDRLAAVAAAIVAKGGLKSLSVRAAAAGAGCATGMVYKAFRDLDDLILRVNATTLDNIAAELSRPVKSKNPKGAALELTRRYIAFARKNHGLWSMLFEHRMERRLPQWYAEKISKGFSPVEKALAPLVRGDGARAAKAARVLWAALHGALLLSETGKLNTAKAAPATALAADLVENYLSGLERGR